MKYLKTKVWMLIVSGFWGMVYKAIAGKCIVQFGCVIK